MKNDPTEAALTYMDEHKIVAIEELAGELHCSLAEVRAIVASVPDQLGILGGEQKMLYPPDREVIFQKRGKEQ